MWFVVPFGAVLVIAPVVVLGLMPATRHVEAVAAESFLGMRPRVDGIPGTSMPGELYLGVETVKTHVSGVPGKLGVRDRLQAVTLAYENRFIEVRPPRC